MNAFFLLATTGNCAIAADLSTKAQASVSEYKEGEGLIPVTDSTQTLTKTASLHPRKGKIPEGNEVYTISGIGAALTSGETAGILSQRTSTSLGFNIGLGRSAFFLYPSADLLVFEYNQQRSDPDFNYDMKKGRSTFTTFNLMAGVRARAGSFSAYFFGGPGLSFVKEPRILVDEAGGTASLTRQKSKSLTLKGGFGLDYKIGAFTLFAEGSYARYFKKFQDRQIEIFPVFGGMKSDISAIFHKK